MGHGGRAFALALTVGLQVEPLRDFFPVVRPSAATWLAVAACSAVGVVALPRAAGVGAGVEARGSS